jgi:hypothetical protein
VLRRIGYWLALGAAVAVLTVVAWPGAPGDPATLINRVDLIAITAMLVVLPWLARRRFGPVRDSWVARSLRSGGFLTVAALVLVKARAERFEYATLPGRTWLAGLWTGEVVFLAVTAVYLAGLLAATARRAPAGPVPPAVGSAAGAVAALVVFVLPPVGNPLHLAKGWLGVVHGLGWGIGLPVVLGGGIAAGLAATRRALGHGGRSRSTAALAWQGIAAGLSAGAAAALLLSVAGISAAALLPGQEPRFRTGAVSAAVAQHVPPWLYQFEMSLGGSAAGYLLVLVFFPVLGAGLGAWGAIVASPRPGAGDGGGGGGGGGGSGPEQPPPADPGGRSLDVGSGSAILSGYLRVIPGLADLTSVQHEPAAPEHSEKIPAGG